MNWSLICKVGFKVLTAAVAGVVVFVGISKAVGDDNSSSAQQPNQGNPNPQPSGENCAPQQSNGEVIVGGLRATQDTCGKLLAFVQSLTMVAENLSRIFGNNQGYNQPYYGSPYYGNGCYCNGRPVNTGGQTWTRISPFIIEAGSGPVRGGYNNYPF